ncbi:DUF2975 domain-containing protein [Sedimentibacter sp. zth1]|uniref:DUF2975 domain-containing protein n=1 Tax=Sedimentibacter sp. zth1 TaxID=2816908 RepID=UPI001A9260B2|nr:DUF2975 domain-containing protein [Sedimentibacter sp. zth1]QSX05068.1 DUF2975 domain-containing protein [Sedimentibacter sp. zth1]
MYEIKPITKFTKILVNIILFLGIATTLAVPYIVPKAIKLYSLDKSLTIPTIITIFISGILAVYILNQIRIMINTIFKGNPFILDNVISFKKMGIAAFIIALIFTIKLLFWFTYATVIIVVVFIIAGLLSLTLKDIFKQAVKFKEDNDLTI